ncbi:MAG TPA: hypothetical protein VMI12_13235 [Puia sp.]|nr:hypothetical protein [Puia sp.]
MKKLSLVIEKSKDGKLWGRVEFNDDLMVDSAGSLDALEKKMKKLLQNFHKVEPSEVKFEPAYDLSALFAQKDYLNVSAIALKAGINPGLMRQYVSGFKYPSLERAKAIEGIINDLGQELIRLRVAVVKNESVAKSKNVKRKIASKKRTRLVSA